MTTKSLDISLQTELSSLNDEGRAKSEERVITAYLPPEGDRGPRYRLLGSDREFIRLNSNSYLSLSNHPELIKAADEATHAFGVGPGAVRFIDGTFVHHVQLEKRVAEFVGHYFTAIGDVATAFRPLSFGLVIVLFLMFEPRGIANWWRITRSYFKLWPFRY